MSDRTARPRRLRQVLIANRGEIAVRIVRACHDLGISAIVAHSDADTDSLAVQLADRRICIGSAPPAASYLNTDALITAAVQLGVDAVHPGYGFLAENARFAELCEAHGISFVGPPSRSIEQMSNKMAARSLAASIGVPVLPGFAAVSMKEALEVAEHIGYPVIIKAAAGGGGRGMRLAREPKELQSLVDSAIAEAESAFGDGSIYLEKFVESARHIEIQVAFDAYGKGIHLGERDCTIQRRYQKLVEECPSPVLDPATREAMAAAAMRLCEEVGYEGVGTVEFLLDRDTGEFAFIEANTRLQVEHPVTEVVTGIDLVELQLRIAAGEPLPFRQEDVLHRGHAFELRLNAEDPCYDFQPSAGVIGRLRLPMGPGVRIDTHVYPGYQVPPFYDSLLAKIIIYDTTRERALVRARRALRELEVTGVDTTHPFHTWLFEHNCFVEADVSTSWIEQVWSPRGISDD